MKVSAQVIINAGLSDVWKVISNIQIAHEIIAGIDKIEVTHQPETGIIGLRWMETRMYFGKPASIEKYVVAVAENACIGIRADLDNVTFFTNIKLTKLPEGIMVKSIHETQAIGFWTNVKLLPMLLFKSVVRRAIQKDLVDYKKFIEKSGI